MILTLEVTGELAAELGAGGGKVFNAIGGTIGRLPDNDWVFPDPYVSGRHALIRYLNGKFFVEDTSTNGVFVNSLDNRLSRAQPHQLKNGDRLYIDAYEIHVSIEDDAADDARNDPFAALQANAARPAMATLAENPVEDRTASLPMRNQDEHATQWFRNSEMSANDPVAQPAPPRKLEPVRPPPVVAERRVAARRAPGGKPSIASAPANRPRAKAPADGSDLAVLLAA